jgi:hypothetical protein
MNKEQRIDMHGKTCKRIAWVDKYLSKAHYPEDTPQVDIHALMIGLRDDQLVIRGLIRQDGENEQAMKNMQAGRKDDAITICRLDELVNTTKVHRNELKEVVQRLSKDYKDLSERKSDGVLDRL